MHAAYLLLLFCSTGLASDFTANITLDRPGTRGDPHYIVVNLELEGEITQTREEGKPRTPLLLIDAPDSILLLGGPPEQLETPPDFQATFLRRPYGRLLFEKETRVPFRVERKPRADEHLEMTLVTYLEGDQPQDARFIRKRYRLPLVQGAKAMEVDATNSRWGIHETLAIGDQAPDFDLPSYDGSRLRLSEFRGKKNVIIVTYRAFW